jgi:RHS repeat-associated protein
LRIVIRSSQMRPAEITDEHGATVWVGDFDEWGLPLSSQDYKGAILGLPGQYWDSHIQLYYNHYRYYSPRDGQFLSPDPIGFLGGLNEYRFGPNPISWVDPLGLRCGQTHMQVVINDDLKAQGGGPEPTRADWYAKQDAFNGGVEAAQQAGTPLTIPTAAQYALDREVGNGEAAAARVAQGMGPGVQADHPVDLRAGGGQGQTLYPLVSGVNGSVGSQVGRQAGQLPSGSPTPMFDLYDAQGSVVRSG